MFHGPEGPAFVLGKAFGISGDLRQRFLRRLAAQRVGQAGQHIAALRRRHQGASVKRARIIPLPGRHHDRQHRFGNVHAVGRQHRISGRLQGVMGGLQARAADNPLLRQLRQPAARLGVQHQDRPGFRHGNSAGFERQQQGIKNNSIHHPGSDTRPIARRKAISRGRRRGFCPARPPKKNPAGANRRGFVSIRFEKIRRRDAR